MKRHGRSHSDRWEKGFALLSRFRARKGHCCPSRLYVDGNYRLGEWVAFQRRRHHEGMLAEQRKQRLDAIGFVWNAQDRLWERGLITRLNFKRREGHCCPSRHHVEGNFKLGQWVSVQRYRKDLLKVERKRRLDAIGFIWDWTGDYVWEQNFAALLKFKRRRGHCRVPISYSEGNLKLGLWVSAQRRNTLVMSAERRARLNKIEFMWRTPTSHTASTDKTSSWHRVTCVKGPAAGRYSPRSGAPRRVRCWK